MKRRCSFAILKLGLLVVFIVHATPVSAQVVTPKDLEEQARQFTRTTAMIPMRDGVRLHTLVYAPKEHEGPLPLGLSAQKASSMSASPGSPCCTRRSLYSNSRAAGQPCCCL